MRVRGPCPHHDTEGNCGSLLGGRPSGPGNFSTASSHFFQLWSCGSLLLSRAGIRVCSSSSPEPPRRPSVGSCASQPCCRTPRRGCLSTACRRCPRLRIAQTFRSTGSAMHLFGTTHVRLTFSEAKLGWFASKRAEGINRKLDPLGRRLSRYRTRELGSSRCGIGAERFDLRSLTTG